MNLISLGKRGATLASCLTFIRGGSHHLVQAAPRAQGLLDDTDGVLCIHLYTTVLVIDLSGPVSEGCWIDYLDFCKRG